MRHNPAVHLARGSFFAEEGHVAQFPAVIELSSLDGSNGFRLSGGALEDFSGSSVASAGDVNGDGFDDVIVGAFGADPNGNNSGASYVVFGQASGFAANIDLSSLDGSNGFKLSGVAAYDRSGLSVASAGDVNGDGFADLIVGADYADPNGLYSGASYVVFGQASGFAANLNLSSLDGSNGFRLSGGASRDYSGRSVASAGDVNGDGFADLIVGASRADPNGSASGASYVVFGQASGFAANLDLSSLDGSNGFKLSGVVADDQSGISIASAGDVNGDGFADVLVGAYRADPTGSDSGASYVVFGQASGFAANLDLSSLDGSNGFRLSGAAASDLSGASVASAGDVNGDGFADVIVGAFVPDGLSGASYVVFGQASGFAANLDLSSLDGSNGFKLSGVAQFDFSGRSVASAGDVNGDGFADVLVGAYRADPAGGDSGASYVVFGQASGFAANLDLSSLDGSNGFKLGGASANDFSGRSVASAGDVNGDGFADLIIGAEGADPNGSYSGASYVVFGVAPDSAVDRLGTSAAQTLAGGAFGDNLFGLGGDDSLFGQGGADTLHGGSGDDALRGGAGNDDLDGGVDNDKMDGGTGVDTADYSDAAAGVTVRLSLSSAQNTGGAGFDTLLRIENLTGSGSNDVLVGNGAANVLIGLGGNDRLNGGGGADQMSGGLGNDVYVVNHAGDQVIEDDNPGDVDTVRSSVDLTLGANVENLILTGSDAIDGTGNELANKLFGNAEANVLSGLAGDDRLSGGDGSDTLIGGAGRDVLTGGADADTFRYLSASDTGATAATRDRIADFVAGTDQIDLAAIDAVDGGTDDAFSFVGAAAFSGTAGELRAGAAGTNTLVSGDLDGDAVADFQILLTGAHTLSAGDFLL
jgi:Ca2+-binding RTX toxin-like protein